MLSHILKRDDVVKLLKEICNNNRYHKKSEELSFNYQQFPLFSSSLFMAVDAFYKYSVVVQDLYLLDGYIEEVELLFKKVSNLSDICYGIHKLIGKFVGLKLGYKNYLEKKGEILKYIYNQYITEGYFFHAISSCYVDDVLENGFIPQQYNHLYDKFIEVRNLVGSEVIESDFTDDCVFFTDSFIMAYYYAVFSPMYFSRFVSNNDDGNVAYFKNDYDLCLKNLNKFIMRLDLDYKSSTFLRKVFDEEWKLLDRSHSYPAIMMVKRKVLVSNHGFDLSTILDDDLDFSEAVGKIFNHRYNRIECREKIDKSKVDIIKLYGYSDLVDEKNTNTGLDEDEDMVIDEYGKVSFLMLMGALFITLGVIITIIMIVRG